MSLPAASSQEQVLPEGDFREIVIITLASCHPQRVFIIENNLHGPSVGTCDVMWTEGWFLII